jgi:Uma2 family endonuclease
MVIPESLQDLLMEAEYPSEDGQPIAESDFQLFPLLNTIQILDTYFHNRPDVYVSGNLLIYYEEGNPKAAVAPDVFVVFGVPKQQRRSYFTWKEGKVPDFVIEITSRSTYAEDLGVKRGLYAFLGVREYFLYDPSGDYLKPSLQGLKLVDDHYLPIPADTLPDGSLSLYSSVLGLELHTEQGELRFYDPDTSRKLLTYQEVEAARQATEARIAELVARLRALEANAPPPPSPLIDN